MTRITKFLFTSAVAAGAACLAIPAMAEDENAPSETVIVTAPRFHVDGATRMNTMPERVSLSTSVRYDDLDLTSREDAYVLRGRIREAARSVCAELRDAYPFRPLNGTSCYRDALENGLMRADEAIRDARSEY